MFNPSSLRPQEMKKMVGRRNYHLVNYTKDFAKRNIVQGDW